MTNTEQREAVYSGCRHLPAKGCVLREPCERCDYVADEDPDLPDRMCWDSRATADDVHLWVARTIANPYGGARHLLSEIGDPRAAAALRQHLAAGDVRVLALVVCALGWSGDATDAALLVPLLRHEDAGVRAAARSSLTELQVPGAADHLAALLDELDPDTDAGEVRHVLDCLAWFGDGRALLPLRRLVGPVEESFGGRHFTLAQALVRLGGVEDRRALADAVVAMADAAVARFRAILTSGTPEEIQASKMPWFRAIQSFDRAWLAYAVAMRARAPEEIVHTLARLADIEDIPADVLRRASWMALPAQADELSLLEPLGDRIVPSRAMVAFSPSPPAGGGPPPAKFFGQPDWRGEPSWPVGPDGPLVFYGQLPLPGPVDRTAYIFLGGADEWEPLGPGNAVVVQPGPACHLPTLGQQTGRQLYDWFPEQPERYRRRTRRLPMVERFVVFADAHDPLSWEFPDWNMEVRVRDNPGDWSKIAGTPLWLQGEESPPGSGWNFAFQFAAGTAGDDRGDGAICYGWTHPDGTAAFGWQCH